MIFVLIVQGKCIISKTNKTTHMFEYFAFEIELTLSLHKQINMGPYLQNSIQYSNCEQCKGLLRISVPTILCFRAKLKRKNIRLCNTPQFIRNPAFAYAKTKALISCVKTQQLINAFVLPSCLPKTEIYSL